MRHLYLLGYSVYKPWQVELDLPALFLYAGIDFLLFLKVYKNSQGDNQQPEYRQEEKERNGQQHYAGGFHQRPCREQLR